MVSSYQSDIFASLKDWQRLKVINVNNSATSLFNFWFKHSDPSC